MKKINTRGWSTPMIIGAGIFVATTGLLMFFVTTDPFRFAHELVGLCFAVAIVLHIMSNWRPFKRYFTQKLAIGIIALAWLVGIGLVTTTALRNEVDTEELVVERIEQTSIQLLAPVVGMEVDELVEQLKGEGFVVDTPQMTIEQLADKHTTETDTILLKVFR
ncbi:MAG: DUF4405 domain-containing protein [Candidatus Poribacteria bacterium]|nr:DUF4405 domain-containing protein [Candidatus Poribacteria bacterium]